MEKSVFFLQKKTQKVIGRSLEIFNLGCAFKKERKEKERPSRKAARRSRKRGEGTEIGD